MEIANTIKGYNLDGTSLPEKMLVAHNAAIPMIVRSKRKVSTYSAPTMLRSGSRANSV